MTTISLNKKIKIISNKEHYISKNIFQLKVLVFEENNMLNEEFYKRSIKKPHNRSNTGSICYIIKEKY